MDGVGPSELNIDSLVARIEIGNTKELLFALPATTEGDTTCFYIFKKLKDVDIKITSLARGVAVGNELQYTDEVTLGRSILARLPFETSLRSH